MQPERYFEKKILLHVIRVPSMMSMMTTKKMPHTHESLNIFKKNCLDPTRNDLMYILTPIYAKLYNYKYIPFCQNSLANHQII